MHFSFEVNIPDRIVEDFEYIVDLMMDFDIDIPESCSILKEIRTLNYCLEFKTNNLFRGHGIVRAENFIYFWDSDFRGGLDSLGIIVRFPTSKLRDMEFMENVMRLMRGNYE